MKNRTNKYQKYHNEGILYFAQIQFCKKITENLFQMVNQLALYIDGKFYLEQDGKLLIIPKARIIKAYNTMPSDCSGLLKDKYQAEIKERYLACY